VSATERRGAVIVGASAGVGRALAHALAERGYDLVIAARSARDLSAVAADVRARHGTQVVALELDIVSSDDQIDAWLARCRAALPRIDAVLIPAGAVDDEDDGVTDWGVTERLIASNFTAVARLALRFTADFEASGHGTLVLFSSIAAAAPRRRNVAYAASKRALESYARSLQHRYAATDVRVQVCALGYVDTEMTRGRRLMLPVASASRVASAIADGLHEPRRFRYVPRFWAVVAFVLDRLPWPIYRRLDF
jgi:short-subunit dehydrogenase